LLLDRVTQLVKVKHFRQQSKVQVAKNDFDIVLMHIMKLVDGASFLLKRIIADFIKHPLSALNQVVSDAVLKLAIHKAE